MTWSNLTIQQKLDVAKRLAYEAISRNQGVLEKYRTSIEVETGYSIIFDNAESGTKALVPDEAAQDFYAVDCDYDAFIRTRDGNGHIFSILSRLNHYKIV